MKKAARAISRRQVLVGAGSAAGALAVTRVMGLHHFGPDLANLPIPGVTPTATPAAVTTQDWNSPLADEAARVAQLLRRATFGHTAAQLNDAAKDGFKRTVDRLIETPPAAPKDLAGADDATKDKPINPVALQSWWVDAMLTSPTPFAERMAFFWHGHFTSDFRKVNNQTPFIYWQNKTWRSMALGSFRDMLTSVTIDPAMLRYLDLGTSTGKSPNENYSRELMELFTMGVGTFSEDDVRAGAKALAGWREPITAAMAETLMAQAQQRGGRARTITADPVKTGVFEASRAYSGSVKFLGETRQWDTKALLDKIAAHDSVAPFIATKVLREFVTPDPSDATVRRIAEGFRKSKYDVKTLMRDVFTSPELTQPTAYRSLVKSPTEFMVHVARALEAPELSRPIAQAGPGMGQALFDPPEVGGWPSNASWVSSNNVLTRVNFVVGTLGGLRTVPPFRDAHRIHLDGIVGPKTADLLNSAQDESSRWLILLASPEFQLK